MVKPSAKTRGRAALELERVFGTKDSGKGDAVSVVVKEIPRMFFPPLYFPNIPTGTASNPELGCLAFRTKR